MRIIISIVWTMDRSNALCSAKFMLMRFSSMIYFFKEAKRYDFT